MYTEVVHTHDTQNLFDIEHIKNNSGPPNMRDNRRRNGLSSLQQNLLTRYKIDR